MEKNIFSESGAGPTGSDKNHITAINYDYKPPQMISTISQ